MSKNLKFWLLTVGILTIAFVVTVWIQEYQKQRLKTEAAGQIEVLNTYYSKEIRRTTESQLRTLSKTFVWALRSEIIRNNLEQADIYMAHLIKEDRFELIVYADNKGIIELSTQKKIEGDQFADHFDADLLDTRNILIEFSDERYQVAAPVLGLTNKLGTLYFQYSK